MSPEIWYDTGNVYKNTGSGRQKFNSNGTFTDMSEGKQTQSL